MLGFIIVVVGNDTFDLVVNAQVVVIDLIGKGELPIH